METKSNKVITLFTFKCLIIYYFFLCYATLAPFQHWRMPNYSVGMIDNLLHGWLTKIFLFDLIQNFLLYLPLGFFSFLLLLENIFKNRPFILIAIITTTMLSFFTSTSLELLQSYNPARVPSLLDVIMNTIGGATGALLGWGLQKKWQNFYNHLMKLLSKPIALIGLGIWAGIQLYPFLPTLHPKRFLKGSAGLIEGFNNMSLINIKLIVAYFIIGIILNILTHIAFNRHVTKITLFFIITVLFSKILIIGRALSFEALVGSLLGVLILPIIKPKPAACLANIK